MAIEFSSVDISFELSNESVFSNWISNAIGEEGFQLGEIEYVFCSDEYLLEINIEHLDHDYFTDIITFDYVVDDLVSSELFVSIDRIKDNAGELKIPFQKELARVLIHGILHLLGYNDSTNPEKLEMSERENYYLNLLEIPNE